MKCKSTKKTSKVFGIILVTGLVVLFVGANAEMVGAAGASRVSISKVSADAFPEVTLDVTVLDGVGVPVPGLKASEFSVTDNGRGATISKVVETTSTEAGLTLVLGLDASGSLAGEPLSRAVGAMTSLVERLSPADRVAAVAGASNCVVTSGPPPSASRDDTKAFLAGIKASGNTPLYGTSLAAIQLAASVPEGRRMVVVVTDGEDRCQSTSADTLIQASVKFGIPLYFVGLGPNVRPDTLRNLARQTGGDYLEAPEVDKLANVYEALVTRLRTRYTVTATLPTLADLKEHTLSVRARVGDTDVSSDTRFTPPQISPEFSLSIGSSEKISTRLTVKVTTTRPVQISKIDVQLDGARLASVLKEPHEFVLDPSGVARGTRKLKVKVTDFVGTESDQELDIQIIDSSDALGVPVWIWLGAVLLLSALAVPIVFTFGRSRSSGAALADKSGSGRGSVGAVALTPQAEALSPASPAFGSPGLWLVVTHGSVPGMRFRVSAGVTTLGRDPGNDVVIDDAGASRWHAQIAFDGLRYAVHAQSDATNGMTVNGRRVNQSFISAGDEIRIGSTALAVEFR